MLQKRKKKDTERIITTRFVSNIELGLPIIDVIDNETPDFIIETINQKISVELTNVVNPELKKREEIQNLIVSDAEKIFLDKYSVNLRVLINFNNIPIVIRKSETKILSTEIFEFIEKIYNNNKNYEFRISTRRKKINVTGYIDSISIDSDLSFSNWQPFGAFLVEKVDKALVINCIEKKEVLLKKYHEKFDENWLVLTANFGNESSTFGFDTDEYLNVKSEFNRIYIYLIREDKIIRIK